MKNINLLIAFCLILPLTGCAGLAKLVQDYSVQPVYQTQSPTQNVTAPNQNLNPVQNQNPDLNQSGTNESQPIIMNAPRITVRQINYDGLLSWNPILGAVKYEIYRSYSYPQKTAGYTLIGTTTSTSFCLEDAYWSGIQFYSVRAVSKYDVKSNFSDYILFNPSDYALD